MKLALQEFREIEDHSKEDEFLNKVYYQSVNTEDVNDYRILKKRMQEHNTGHVRSTALRRPLTLIYAENYDDKYEAFRMERFYKTAKGKRILKLKLKK